MPTGTRGADGRARKPEVAAGVVVQILGEVAAGWFVETAPLLLDLGELKASMARTARAA
jgi:hypothetical protein